MVPGGRCGIQFTMPRGSTTLSPSPTLAAAPTKPRTTTMEATKPTGHAPPIAPLAARYALLGQNEDSAHSMHGACHHQWRACGISDLWVALRHAAVCIISAHLIAIRPWLQIIILMIVTFGVIFGAIVAASILTKCG